MENVKWEGNSKKMYETILKATPELLHGGVKKLVQSWINKKEVEVVTEDIVFQVLNDITPSKARNQLIPVLESIRTK